jgi:glutamine amidotransferase
MSILFSCTCNQPERLLTALEPVRQVLLTEDVTRWGLSYVQAGQVLLSRHPRAVAGSFDFYDSLGQLNSDYLIGCADVDLDYKGNNNTQPFRFRHWMFALQSDLQDFARVHESVASHMPDFLRRSIKGKTPAEYVFFLFLSLLHDSAQIDDHNVDPNDCAAAIQAALALAKGIVKEAGLEGDFGNLMLSNSRCMIAVRQAGPLYLRRLRQLEDPKRPDTEFRSVLVVSAKENPGEGFEELPEDSILIVKRDLNTDILQG